MKPAATKNTKSPAKKKGYNPNSKSRKNAYHKEVELKPIDEVKAFFRDYFRKNNTAGHIMSKEDVIKHVLKKLTPKEDSLFAEALNALKVSGFIEVKEDGVTLMLTQKGADSFSG